jgi:LPPG:FO 2-phospho-L-lactate transferase
MSTRGPDMGRGRRIVALCGGVGGAKLAFGLARALGEDLAIVVNTGDDFEHLGFHISPDLDTVLYTLAGLANRQLGWGRADETWNFMEVLGQLGGETWFQLGDRDLALHVARTQAMAAGGSLTAFMADIASRLGIAAKILPMTDDAVRTIVETAEGNLPFQRYFVEARCAPVVSGIHFHGAQQARPGAEVRAALTDPALAGIVICPSNPFLSVDPILAVPGLRDLLRASGAPVVAVSPIIGGRAVKGPTDKIMRELGVPATAKSIVEHYHGLLDGLVLDTTDAAQSADLDLPCHVTATLMSSDEDRERLARETLQFAASLASRTGS